MINVLEYKGYNGTVEYSAEDKLLCGNVIGIRSLISYEGDSLQSLEDDFKGAIDDYLEERAERGSKPEKPFKGSFNVRIGSELHQQAALLALSRGQSLNMLVENAIRQAVF